MRFTDMLPATVREGDGRAMVEAIERLPQAGIDARRPDNNPHQIKVTPSLSFYPGTGRIVEDSQPALPQRGMAALIALLSNTSV